MLLSNGQSILLDWFKHNSGSSHNLSKIRVICQNISIVEGYGNDTNYLYRHFFPLVRIGIVEYLGNDNYSLSNPVLHIIGDVIIAVNFDTISLKSISHLCKASFFSDLVLYFGSNSKKEIEDGLKATCMKLNISSLFKSLPNILSFVELLQPLQLVPDSGFRKYNYYGWTSTFTSNEIGCYKASDNIASKRYILTSALQWKEIPNRNINPDAFNLAVCYTKVESQHNIGIQYDKQKMELKIFDIHFPIIIERLIWIFYLNRLDDVIIDVNNHLLFTNFPFDTFKQLNRFFLNKIQIL